MQVTDTVRAVHTAGAIRRAFFATVLSVQPSLPEDIGTNGEPTITMGFIDPTLVHLVGGIDWYKAFRRITTVRHVSHDEVQTNAAEYCWTDVLPNDGGPIALPNLNMVDLEAPAAEAAETESTIGTIVYINHNNDLEVKHTDVDEYAVLFDDELHLFSDLFSAQVFVDAKPATGMTDDEADTFTAQKIALAGTFLGAEQRIEGSPRDLLGHQMYGEDSEEVAKARYEIHKKNLADVAAASAEEAAATSVIVIDRSTAEPQPAIVPSAADLDAHAADDQAKADTSGAQVIAEQLPPDSPDPLAAL